MSDLKLIVHRVGAAADASRRSRSSACWMFLIYLLAPAGLWLTFAMLASAERDAVRSWIGIAPPTGAWALGPLLATLIAYPLLEEIVFRSFLQQRIERRLRLQRTSRLNLNACGAGLLANVVTSSLFSLAHAPLHGGAYALIVFAPSLLLGKLYLRHRNLRLNVFVHAYWNALVLACSLTATVYK